MSRGRGYTLALAADEAVLALGGSRHSKVESRKQRGETRKSKFETRNSKLETRSILSANPEPRTPNPDVLLRMRLVGANPNAKITPSEELAGKSNYFIGSDPQQWQTNIPNYARVEYRDVYPGVDLVYYGNEGSLEYDFVVAPGADPSTIIFSVEAVRGRSETGNWKLETGDSALEARSSRPTSLQSKIQNPKSKIDGRLRLDSNSDLLVVMDGGEVRFRKPVVYQEQLTVDSRQSTVPKGVANQATISSDRQSSINRQFLDGHYVLSGLNQVRFEVASYDHSQPLIIDPTLTYSTYLGGSESDVGYGIAVDGSGSAYIAGQTCSANFPTQGPEQSSNAGNCDAFVTKMNPTGSALVYSTYLGGSEGDSAVGIAIDSSGNAYVTGFTNSMDFPTTKGSFQPAYGGGDTDTFITKLDPTGSTLVYSTYLGGSGADAAYGIAVDSSGDAYVAGSTASGDFPVTTGAFQTTLNGAANAFVTELNPSGSGLVFSTYLGGSETDAAYSVALDSQGAAFVTGATDSGDFPLQGLIQAAFEGCPKPPAPAFPCDAFVTKIQPGGSSLVYSTYLGGTGADAGYGIAVDSVGNAYAVGWTASSDFPVTAGAFQAALAGTANAFVSKLNPLGSALAYSTYLGGNGVDEAFAVAVDINSIAHVTGGTTSSNFPTVGALQPNLNGPLAFPGDAFVTKVDSSGGGLVYSSFLGGGDQDVGNGIAVDSASAVYVTGATSSTDFPTTPNAFQTVQAGLGDAFVTKLTNLAAPVAIVSPRSLNYSSQGLSLPSPPQTVTITNSGDANLTISQIIEAGGFYQPPTGGLVDMTDWQVSTDNCTGAVVPPSSNCTFSVVFDPTPLSTGPRNGTITITDNATSNTQVVSLSGTGVPPPVATLNQATLTFSSQLSGTTSAPQNVTLTNTGGFTLAISSIQITGDFAQTNTCSATLGAGLSCTVSVTFSPTTSGTRNGTLTFTDDATGSPQSVSLSGTGTAPLASLSALTLTFTSQPVNTASSPQSVTLTNTGTATLNINGITLGGANSSDYALIPASTCGASVGAQASCIINVTFSPAAAGTRVAVISVGDNAQGSPQVISLSGTGVLAPNVSLTDTNLNFSPQNVGTTSSPQTVTLKNTGSAALEITGSASTGDFAQTNTCFATLPVGSSCAITVTFTPTAAGNRYGSVTVTDNALNSPQTIVLGGVGLGVPIASLSPTNLTFTGQAVGSVSIPQSVTLSNTGTATLNISGITLGGANSSDYALTPVSPPALPCGVSVAAGTSCTINVTFGPTAGGTRTAVINVADNAQGSPQVIALTGRGIVAPSASLSNTNLTFTPQDVGTTSAPQTVTLTNTGSVPLGITGSGATGDFAQTNNCPATLLSTPGQNSCVITVTFTPTAPGNRYGSATVADNALNSPQTIVLGGVGLAAPIASVSPATLTFGGQSVGTTSAAQTVTIANTGSAALSISSITASGDFAETNACPLSIAPGNNCTISVTFTPTAAGRRTGTLTIADNVTGSPQVVALVGSGADFTVAVTPSSVTTYAGTPANYTVTITPQNGFNGKVTFGCSNLPPLSTCSASPASVTEDGTTAMTATLTVNTTVRSWVLPRRGPKVGWPRVHAPGALPSLIWLLLFGAIAVTAAMLARPRRAQLVLVVVLLLLLSWMACGGGGAGGVIDPTGTPAGTYNISISGTSGVVGHSTSVILVVQ